MVNGLNEMQSFIFCTAHEHIVLSRLTYFKRYFNVLKYDVQCIEPKILFFMTMLHNCTAVCVSLTWTEIGTVLCKKFKSTFSHKS